MLLTLTSEARVLTPKQAGSKGAAPVGGKAPQQIFFSQSGHIYMKNAKCAETNEKSNFSSCIFWDMVFYVINVGQFSVKFEYKIDHISKNKDGRSRKVDFSFVSEHCAFFCTKNLILTTFEMGEKVSIKTQNNMFCTYNVRITSGLQHVAVSHLRTCRQAPPPLQKWSPQKVVMNGAECSE